MRAFNKMLVCFACSSDNCGDNVIEEINLEEAKNKKLLILSGFGICVFEIIWILILFLRNNENNAFNYILYGVKVVLDSS